MVDQPLTELARTRPLAASADRHMIGQVSGGTDAGRDAVIAQEPIGRMGRPEQLASAVLWLSSDLGGASSWAGQGRGLRDPASSRARGNLLALRSAGS